MAYVVIPFLFLSFDPSDLVRLICVTQSKRARVGTGSP